MILFFWNRPIWVCTFSYKTTKPLQLAISDFVHLFFYVKVRNEFYKDTQGVMLVYDVGQKDSFDALDTWLAEMKQDLGPHGNMENIVFVVCANKVTALEMVHSAF